MPTLLVRLFGSPSVTLDGGEILFPYKKADALFFYILMQRKCPRTQLSELLWPDDETPAALKNLRHAVHTIRKTLGFDPFLAAQRTMLELDPQADISCDVWDFARTDDPGFYRGEFLQHFHLNNADALDEWIDGTRSAYQARYLSCLSSAMVRAYQSGELDRAEQYGEACLRADPLDENAVALMMRLYARQRKYRKAISVYNALCRCLSSELSITPLKETTALHYEIINEWNRFSSQSGSSGEQQLFGKEQALRALRSFYSRPEHGDGPRSLVLQGKAGVGKSYLLGYFLSQYDFSDRLILRGTCYSSESGFAFSAWSGVMLALSSALAVQDIRLPDACLKTAAELFPCLCSSEDTPLLEEAHHPHGDYRAAMDAVGRLLALVSARTPLLFVLEDIHWMDRQSTELLALILRRLDSAPIQLLCTARDTLPAHVRDLLAHSERDKLVRIVPVADLTREEMLDFLSAALPVPLSPDTAEQIYQNTGGNALLLTQLINTMQESPERERIPSSPDDILRQRLTRLSREEMRVLEAMSVFDGWIPLDVLPSILSTEYLELVCLCDQLCQKRLLSEETHGEALGYSFTHERIQSLLAARLSESYRRILHLRAAQCLESGCTPDTPPPYEQIIHHCLLGGDRYKVFKYQVLFLYSSSELCYELLPTLSPSSDAPLPDEQRMVHEFDALDRELRYLRSTRFDADTSELDRLERTLLHTESRYYIHNGSYQKGLSVLERLLQCSVESGEVQGIVMAHLQFVYYGIQIYDIAVMEQHLSAIAAFEPQLRGTQTWGTYLRLCGLLSLMRGEYAAARMPLEQALAIFSALNAGANDQYSILIAGVYNYLAESYRLEQNFAAAFDCYDQAIIYNRSRGYYPGAAVFYTNYGVAAFQKQNFAEARSLFEYAESIYRSSHEYSEYPIALSALAYFDALDRNFDSACERLTKALEVSRMIGSPWWMGVTLYLMWRIRRILPTEDHPAFSSLWPATEREHCTLALSYLRRIELRSETSELEQRLHALDNNN